MMCPRSPSARRFRKRTTFLSLLFMCESWHIPSSLVAHTRLRPWDVINPEPTPEPVEPKKRAAVAEKWSKMVNKLKIKRNAGTAKDQVAEQVDLIC
jgi:hypothetical protein